MSYLSEAREALNIHGGGYAFKEAVIVHAVRVPIVRNHKKERKQYWQDRQRNEVDPVSGRAVGVMLREGFEMAAD